MTLYIRQDCEQCIWSIIRDFGIKGLVRGLIRVLRLRFKVDGLGFSFSKFRLRHQDSKCKIML